VQKFDGHSHHRALAIVDRVIRTIRDNAAAHTVFLLKNLKTNNNVRHAVQVYNASLDNLGLVPKLVDGLVKAYNKNPHSYLTKMLGKPTAPNDVTDAQQEFLRDKLHDMNDEVKSRQGYDLYNGQKVDVERKFNHRTKHDRISAYEEGLVKNKLGSYYTVNYGTTTHTVPRWQITNPK
jgi:hypothetical protein